MDGRLPEIRLCTYLDISSSSSKAAKFKSFNFCFQDSTERLCRTADRATQTTKKHHDTASKPKIGLKNHTSYASSSEDDVVLFMKFGLGELSWCGIL